MSRYSALCLRGHSFQRDLGDCDEANERVSFRVLNVGDIRFDGRERVYRGCNYFCSVDNDRANFYRCVLSVLGGLNDLFDRSSQGGFANDEVGKGLA